MVRQTTPITCRASASDRLDSESGDVLVPVVMVPLALDGREKEWLLPVLKLRDGTELRKLPAARPPEKNASTISGFPSVTAKATKNAENPASTALTLPTKKMRQYRFMLR